MLYNSSVVTARKNPESQAFNLGSRILNLKRELGAVVSDFFLNSTDYSKQKRFRGRRTLNLKCELGAVGFGGPKGRFKGTRTLNLQRELGAVVSDFFLNSTEYSG